MLQLRTDLVLEASSFEHLGSMKGPCLVALGVEVEDFFVSSTPWKINILGRARYHGGEQI